MTESAGMSIQVSMKRIHEDNNSSLLVGNV